MYGYRAHKQFKEMAIQNSNTHVQVVNFDVGDYFLISQRLSTARHNLLVQWSGRRRIIKFKFDLIYEFENLIKKTWSLVHTNLMKLYTDSNINVTEKLRVSIDNTNHQYHTTIKILNKQRHMYYINWKWL